jgi:hypothetical protein
MSNPTDPIFDNHPHEVVFLTVHLNCLANATGLNVALQHEAFAKQFIAFRAAILGIEKE